MEKEQRDEYGGRDAVLARPEIGLGRSRAGRLFEKTGPRTPKVGMPGGLTSVHGQLKQDGEGVDPQGAADGGGAARGGAQGGDRRDQGERLEDLDESTVKVTDMLTLVKTLMKDKGIESARSTRRVGDGSHRRQPALLMSLERPAGAVDALE